MWSRRERGTAAYFGLCSSSRGRAVVTGHVQSTAPEAPGGFVPSLKTGEQREIVCGFLTAVLEWCLIERLAAPLRRTRRRALLSVETGAPRS
jgi:hypothetical protein